MEEAKHGEGAVETVLVEGYFNANRYPVNIMSPALGINVTVPSRGYLMSRDGRKINDPRLEELIGPGRLSREMSNEPVPLVAVVMPGVGTGPRTVYHSPVQSRPLRPSTIPAAGRDDKIPPAQTIPQTHLDKVAREAGGGGPIQVLSIQEAERRGLFGRPARTPVRPVAPTPPPTNPSSDTTEPVAETTVPPAAAPVLKSAHNPNKDVPAHSLTQETEQAPVSAAELMAPAAPGAGAIRTLRQDAPPIDPALIPAPTSRPQERGNSRPRPIRPKPTASAPPIGGEHGEVTGMPDLPSEVVQPPGTV